MQDLINEISRLKRVEQTAKSSRVYLEQQLAQGMDLKLEGTTSVKTETSKISITTKLNRKLDYDKYLALGLPENMGFVDLKPSINITNLRAIERIDPTLIASCVTVKPAKPSIKIEEV